MTVRPDIDSWRLLPRPVVASPRPIRAILEAADWRALILGRDDCLAGPDRLSSLDP